jgi:class 3 adenylate cyclase
MGSVSKFSPDRFPPGSFDIAQDISRGLPVELVERWTRSDQTHQAALALLDPYQVHCTIVSSDSVGLTRLTQEYRLIEILAIIHRPKEILHAWGAALGGAAAGIWAADNTQMLYPASIPLASVCSMLLSAMDQIRAECRIQVGLAVHQAHCYLLEGGLYGAEASHVEHLAEELSAGGEILLTQQTHALLPAPHAFRFSQGRHALTLLDGPRAEGLHPADTHYPAPFHRTLFDEPAPMVECSVAILEHELDDSPSEPAAILNNVAISAALARLSTDLLGQFGGRLIKTAGAAAIFTFPRPAAAIGFCRRMREEFLARGLRIRAGIDHGSVMLFDLGHGLYEIAGMPVNIASKLAQDYGVFGAIQLSPNARSDSS